MPPAGEAPDLPLVRVGQRCDGEGRCGTWLPTVWENDDLSEALLRNGAILTASWKATDRSFSGRCVPAPAVCPARRIP